MHGRLCIRNLIAQRPTLVGRCWDQLRMVLRYAYEIASEEPTFTPLLLIVYPGIIIWAVSALPTAALVWLVTGGRR